MQPFLAVAISTLAAYVRLCANLGLSIICHLRLRASGRQLVQYPEDQFFAWVSVPFF